MKFSAQQEKALQDVARWHRSGDSPFYYLAGYAGTGKSSIAKYIGDTIGGDVRYACYTGKAASVMRDKGCRDATTIHRLIYIPSAKGTKRLRDLQDDLKDAQAANPPDARKIESLRTKIVNEVALVRSPSFILNEDSEIRGASLVVIDECSMVNGMMGEDLLSFSVPVLVLGDPAQLPPVRGSGYFTDRRPDFLLEEVHRQALESGVLRMATDIRLGNVPAIGTDYGDAEVISWDDVNPQAMLDYDQILVGLNRTRNGTNARVRELLGRTSPLPQAGDRVICTRNNHDLGLLNGEMWEVLDSAVVDNEKVGLTITDSTNSLNVEAWQCFFLGEKLAHYDHNRDTQEFDYGYVITVHKAQGSEFDRVVVFDQSMKFRQYRLSWLYTAVTRAISEVTLVQ